MRFPYPRFPVGVLIVLLNISGEIFNIAMYNPRLQLTHRSVNHDVLMDFHVTHRCVLQTRAAFELPLPTAEQAKFVERRSAVPKPLTKKKYIQANVVAVRVRISNCAPDLGNQLGAERLVCVEE